MIRKRGGRFYVFSSKGKRLSKGMPRKRAVRRLQQIEWFKHHPYQKGKRRRR